MTVLSFQRPMSPDRMVLEAREADYQRLLVAVRELVVAIDVQGKGPEDKLDPTERLQDAVRELRGYVK